MKKIIALLVMVSTHIYGAQYAPVRAITTKFSLIPHAFVRRLSSIPRPFPIPVYTELLTTIKSIFTDFQTWDGNPDSKHKKTIDTTLHHVAESNTHIPLTECPKIVEACGYIDQASLLRGYGQQQADKIYHALYYAIGAGCKNYDQYSLGLFLTSLCTQSFRAGKASFDNEQHAKRLNGLLDLYEIAQDSCYLSTLYNREYNISVFKNSRDFMPTLNRQIQKFCDQFTSNFALTLSEQQLGIVAYRIGRLRHTRAYDDSNIQKLYQALLTRGPSDVLPYMFAAGQLQAEKEHLGSFPGRTSAIQAQQQIVTIYGS